MPKILCLVIFVYYGHHLHDVDHHGVGEDVLRRAGVVTPVLPRHGGNLKRTDSFKLKHCFLVLCKLCAGDLFLVAGVKNRVSLCIVSENQREFVKSVPRTRKGGGSGTFLVVVFSARHVISSNICLLPIECATLEY